MKKTTILLYGRTGAGKTAQIGLMAEYLYVTTGKITRLYTVDKGGIDSIRPYVDLGIIELIEVGKSDPWIFLNKAAKGYVRDDKGKWVPGDLSNVGMIAFESMRAFAESMMMWMAVQGSKGVNIGGGSNVSFSVNGDGENVKVGGSNQAHFGVAQARVTEEVWESQKLEVPYLLWTTSVSKDDDAMSSGKILGPDVIGKALTGEVPRWFNLTFRIDVLPAKGGAKERHLLYMGSHVDVNAGGAGALGNVRTPLDSPIDKTIIEPASLVEALKLLDGGYDSALEAIKKRIAKI